ncbi:hypothetical protein C5167_021788 [Papaver somniferum]|uniref:Reverse transcriptase zinc-binding domain-containing protein n=1 Tax=Papaver somniferum TaxID=3469 RepID=A0A4Y7JHM5_PAPSO|nr:hypothetical protein C5167_021788 [Papaver somniferum]
MGKIRENSVWKVGNGNKIRIIDDVWCPQGLSLKNGQDQLLQGEMVNSLMDCNNHPWIWNTNKLRLLFEEITVTDIQDIPINSERDDQLVWQLEKNEKFSTKSLYNKLIRTNQPTDRDQTRFWKKLWGLNIQPRLKTFLWKCVHSILLLNGRIAQILPDVNKICPNCGKCDWVFKNKKLAVTRTGQEIMSMISSNRNMLNNKEGKDKIDIVKSRGLLGARSFQAIASAGKSIEHQAASFTIQWSQQLNFPQVQFESDKVKVLEVVREQVLEMKNEKNRLHISNSLNFKLCMLGVKSLSLIPNSANFMACKLAEYCMSATYFREWDYNSITAFSFNLVRQENNNIGGTVSTG